MAQHMKHRETTGKEKLQEAIHSLAENLGEMGSATKEMATESAEGIRGDIAHLYERGQEKVEGFERKIESEIKRSPWRALAVAAGIGFLIGWLRKKRKS